MSVSVSPILFLTVSMRGAVTVGSATTDGGGVARIGFAAPPNEGDAAIVALANGL